MMPILYCPHCGEPMFTEETGPMVIDLGLPTLTYNALHWADIETVAQLRRMSDTELLRLPNLGRVGLQAIRRALKRK